MTNRILTPGYGFAAALVALVVAFTMLGSPAAHADEPVIVYQNLNEGDVLAETPYVIQMCFADPIDIRDQPDGGDWEFRMTSPQGSGSGIRIVFQPNAYGVAMYPVAPPSIPAIPTNEGGVWTYSYRVADQRDGKAIEGEVHFTIDPDADAIPRATPPSCTPEGGTGTATTGNPTNPPPDAATDTPRPTRTPNTTGSVLPTTAAPSGSPEASGSGGASPTAASDDNDGGGTDVLPIVLIALGVVGLAGGAGAAVYYVRKRRA